MLCFTPPFLRTPPKAMRHPNTPPPRTSLHPPTHHLSTVIYPSTSAHLATLSTSESLDALHYGRLGSPTALALESALAAHLPAHGVLLTPSKSAALLTALTTFLRAGDTLAVTQLHYDTAPLISSLLPRLGVQVQHYTHAPHAKMLLVSSPLPPHFIDIPPLPSNTKVVLDNVGLLTSCASAFASGVDVVVSAANQSAGLLDCDASMSFGFLAVNDEPLYRRVRSNVRSSLAPASGTAPPDDVVRSCLNMRTAAARQKFQRKSALFIAEELDADSRVQCAWKYPDSADIALQLPHPEAFLDSLQIVRIADGVGAGCSASLAWPWPFEPNKDYQGVVLSVGLENVDCLLKDITRALDATI